MYRLRDGRFEQIGLSWLKHGFSALFDDVCGCGCVNPFNSQLLGVGCSDPYSAGLNGSQNTLGPRSEVIDSATGTFLYPPVLQPVNQDLTWRRLRVQSDDVNPALNVGALYFVEGHYITADDATSGNAWNNASHRRVAVGTDPDRTISYLDSTRRQLSAIHAWQEADPSVTLVDVPDGEGGLLTLCVKVSDLGGGQFEYEYALYNLNSTRSVGSLSVPLPAGVTASNPGFHDVEYHSDEIFDGTDWVVTNGPSAIEWDTDTFATNPNANALRFSTLYNFRFRANAAPGATTLSLGLFEPGVGSTLTVSLPGPATVVPLIVTLPNGALSLVNPGGGDTLLVDITPISGQSVVPGSALFFLDTGSGFVSTPLTALIGTEYSTTLPATTCGTTIAYYLTAEATNGTVVTVPAAGATAPFVAESAF